MTDNIPSPDPREHKTYYLDVTLTRRILVSTARGLFHFVSVSQVRGAENLPAAGPVIVAANHLTEYDVFPLQFALPRPIFFMGKAELFRHPVMDWLLRRLGGFPVYRGGGDEWALRYAQRILEHGLVLGLFPEGTRSRGQGLRPAKTGVARLAQATNCPIVPVALHGPQYMFRRFPRRTRIDIAIGAPLHPHPDETHINLTERVMFALAALLPPEARGAYKIHPHGF